MTFNTAPAVLIDLSSGLLLFGLGIGVLLIRPRLRANIALSVFSITLGGTFVAINLFEGGSPQADVSNYIGAMLGIMAAVSLVALMLFLPGRQSRMTFWVVALPTAVVTTLTAIAWTISAGPLLANPYTFAILVIQPAFWFSILFLPIRFASQTVEEADQQRNQTAILAAALVLYPGLFGGALLLLSLGGAFPIGFPGVTLIVISSMIWLWNSRRGGAVGKSAMRVALLSLLMPLLGMLHVIFLYPGEGRLDGPPGVARTATVLILVYAIIRHQLLGIDVKVRWGISKTTLAGIFVAVFFVASELAQQFFGERLGGPYVGIIAAGLLVFAIAPLSRFADRVAERAIPLHEKPDGLHPGLSAEGLERAYSAGVRAAMRDGVITRREERHLAELADNLGIPAAQALRIREQIEEEEVTPPGV